jgi:glycosyltransferase involved in cell wall biosynthesis
VAEGFSSDKTSVVQNSIDSSALRESVTSITPIELESFAKVHDLRGKTALFIGALDESKRLAFLRDAAVDLHRQEPNFRLLLAGDGGMRAQVEEWARTFSWIKYLGPLTGRDKAVALTSSDVLAMPGRVGLVAVDSFAAGVPIVTTDWPWHAPEFEYLEDGRNAIVTPDNSTAYTNGLLGVLRNPELLGELRRAAWAAKQIYSVDTMSKNFLEGIRGALASRNL